MASRSSLDVSLLRILREKSKGTVCFFDRGEYVGVYDEDAMLVAREIFKSEVGVKRIQIGERRLAYITLGGGQYERVIRDILVVLRYRVQLFKSRDGSWELKSHGSAGNMADFEELGELGKEASPIIAVHLPKTRKIHGKVQAAILDPSSLRMTYADLEDDDKLSHLEQCIISSNARECLIVGEGPPDRVSLLKKILRRANLLVTYKTKPAAMKNLIRLLADNEKEILSTMQEEVGYCLCWVSEYAGLSQSGWIGKFKLTDYTNGRFMRLDSAAVKAFELFAPANSCGNSGTQGTVYATLNRCKTLTGQRLLREWLARPLCDTRLIQERHNCVQALVAANEERNSLHNTHLSKLPDLAFLARRLIRKKARLLDCYRISQAIRGLSSMRDCVWRVVGASEACAASVKELLLLPLAWGCEQFDGLVQCVEHVIDDSLLKSGGGLRVKPSIDPVLDKIAKRLNDIEKRCQKALAKISLEMNSQAIKLDCTTQHGYVFRVTNKDDKDIRNSSSIKIVDSTKGAGLRFRDSRLIELNEEYMEVNGEYCKAQKHLEDTTVEICGTYASSLSSLSSQLAVLDVLVSFSVVASSSTRPHIRPVVLPQGDPSFSIAGCRHAVLDPLIHFIPNDVNLSDTRAIVVTGANMGGKSTYLRSAALTSILAQMGAFVPADEARIAIVEAIHARVGASDRLSKGVSTFMSEMLECAKMIQTATCDSLVVVDEIGRGTSTFDGFGLAWGITSELINNVGCRLLVATHFTELAAIQNPPRVVALQMKVHAEGEQLALLYEARTGIAPASLGIHVARMVGIDEKTLQNATAEFHRLETEEKRKKKELAAIREAHDSNLRSAILAARF